MQRNDQFLQGGGNMGELIRAFDWENSPLGPVDGWPTALKIATGIMLATPFPMYIAWGEQYTQLYNDGYRPILGSLKHPSALGGSTVETFSEIWPIIGPMFKGVMEGKAVGFPNFKLDLNRNGYLEECWFDFSYSPIPNENGVIGGVLVTVIETTERIKAEAAFANAKGQLETANAASEKQRARLNRFFMEAPAGICILDGPELVFELINPRYQLFFPGRQLLGKPLLTAIPEIKDQEIYQILQQVYKTGKTYEGNGLKISLAADDNGPVSERYFNFIYQARFNDHGKVDGIMVFVFEVTEMMEARFLLAETEDTLKMSLSAARVGIFDLDFVKGTLEWDKRCRELFGIDHGEAINYEHDFVGGLHPDDRERILDIINNQVLIKAVSNGDYDVEYRTVGLKDKKLRWIKALGKTYFNEDDQPTRFLGVAIDITEGKLNELRKNDFIGMVSHELKTPLTSIKGYVQLAKHHAISDGDELLATLMTRADNQLTKMNRLINGFLNLSRLEAGKIVLEKVMFDMCELTSQVVSDQKIVSPVHEIVLQGTQKVNVFADRDKIESVISNLISNAIKYSPSDGPILINCELQNDKVVFTIRDCGIGIKEQDIKRIFERYYRVENGNLNTISGFGIGLYLSAEIIHRHGGEISAESVEGKGSTFWFTLPVEI